MTYLLRSHPQQTKREKISQAQGPVMTRLTQAQKSKSHDYSAQNRKAFPKQ